MTVLAEFRANYRYATSETPRGRVSGRTSELGARRFRFAGKKEAADAGVAVMGVGIMEIEYDSGIG